MIWMLILLDQQHLNWNWYVILESNKTMTMCACDVSLLTYIVPFAIPTQAHICLGDYILCQASASVSLQAKSQAQALQQIDKNCNIPQTFRSRKKRWLSKVHSFEIEFWNKFRFSLPHNEWPSCMSARRHSQYIYKVTGLYTYGTLLALIQCWNSEQNFQLCTSI